MCGLNCLFNIIKYVLESTFWGRVSSSWFTLWTVLNDLLPLNYLWTDEEFIFSNMNSKDFCEPIVL